MNVHGMIAGVDQVKLERPQLEKICDAETQGDPTNSRERPGRDPQERFGGPPARNAAS